MKQIGYSIVLFGYLLPAAFAAAQAHAVGRNVIVGVNIVGPDQTSEETQDALPKQLQNYDVKNKQNEDNDPKTIFRCGALSEAGKVALAPM